MCSPFRYGSVIKNNNFIGILNRRYPVTDYNGRLAAHYFFKVIQNLFLSLCIYSRKAVIKNQDRWGAYNGARNGYPLLLPARKRNAAFAQHGLEFFREIIYIVK